MTRPTAPQPDGSPLSRRAFIKSLLIAVTASTSLPIPLMLGACSPSPSEVRPAWLPLVTGDKNAVFQLGQAYLAAHPAEQDSERLSDLIDKALGKGPALATSRQDNPEHIAQLLKQNVRKDYQNDDVVSLQGWVLSRTEARLYALASLLQTE